MSQTLRELSYSDDMNAPTGKLIGEHELDVRLTTFYRLRSEMLDCFADIERTLLIYISKNKSKSCCLTLPLGHKIETAKKIAADPNRSRELKAKADAELDKLGQLLPVRADIVHSRMDIAVTTTSQFIAIFRNSKDTQCAHPEALVFNAKELENFVLSLSTLSKTLTKALNAQNPHPKPKC